MLRVEDLSFYYGPRKILDGLSFEIRKGQLVGFLGPNGAGKTTTMSLITGLFYPMQGQIFIQNISMTKEPLIAKKHVGFLPEHAPLYLDMTVSDYLYFVAELKGVEKQNLQSYVKEAIEKTRLGEVHTRFISRLSKGYRQRVGLAQAIVAKPALIVLDEPTVGFDPQQVQEFKNLLKSLRGEHTVLWSTHILADVEDTCDEVIVIDHGRKVAHGPMSEIVPRAQQRRELHLTVRLPSLAFAKRVRELPGVMGVEEMQNRYVVIYGKDDIADQVIELAAHEKVGVLQIETDKRDLQSLFLQLTQPEAGERA